MKDYNSQARIDLDFSSQKKIDLNFISKLLNLKADICYQKGENYKEWGIPKHSLWKKVMSQGSAGEELNHNLILIVKQLESIHVKLQEIQEKEISGSITIIVNKEVKDNVGLDLEFSTIKILSHLGLDLSFNVYDQ